MLNCRSWRIVLVLALFAAGGVRADDLPRAPPDELGFSAERLARIDQFFGSKVQAGEMVGIVTLVARHGKIAHFSAVGYADLEKKQKMRTDNIFRLYSMTKPIAATALMTLYEEGKFQIDDPISKYIPEFSGVRVLRTPNSPLTDTVPAVREPTVHDLFRHTAGLRHGGEAYQKADLFGLDTSLAEMSKRLAKLPLYYQPGTQFEYSVGSDVQARLVEILSGMSFDEFLRERFFGPLGMRDTEFWVPPNKADRLATLYWAKDGKLLPLDQAHGHPEGQGPSRGWIEMNSYTKNRKQKGGSSGLVSTAEDYWRFAQMMLNGGEFEGKRVLGPNTVRYMTSDHLAPVIRRNETGGDSGIGWGLGFAVLKNPVAAGVIGSEGSYYWAGVANTNFWIDPKKDLVVVAMSQSYDVPNADWQAIRAQLSAMVYGALLE